MATRIEIIGHLGHDSEIREKDGRQWLSFDVAPSQGKEKDGNGTMWVSCLYGNVKLQQWLVKGRQVFVRGDYRDRLYARKDGTAGIDRQVFVSELELLGNAERAEQNPLLAAAPRYAAPTAQPAPQPQGYQYPNHPTPAPAPQGQPKAVSLEGDDEDLPF